MSAVLALSDEITPTMEVVELASARAYQIMEGSNVVGSNLVTILTLIDNITPTIVVIELASARCMPEVGSKRGRVKAC